MAGSEVVAWRFVPAVGVLSAACMVHSYIVACPVVLLFDWRRQSYMMYKSDNSVMCSTVLAAAVRISMMSTLLLEHKRWRLHTFEFTK